MTADQMKQFAIERLKALGYAYAYGPVIAHEGERPERASHVQVLLLERLRAAVRRMDAHVPAAAQEHCSVLAAGRYRLHRLPGARC